MTRAVKTRGDGTPERRPYASAVRAESARRTRRAVVVAATELFVTDGYRSTSLADVATHAGVARPTVIAAFGSKPGLLKEALDQALAGDDEPVPVRDRPWFAPVWEARTAPAALDAYAGVCVLIAARAAAVVEVVRRASDTAPETAELWDSWLRGRRAGAEMVIRHPAVEPALRADLTVETAGDVLWTLNDTALHAALVGRQGWTEPGYRRWLADTMCRLLLDPAGGVPQGDL